MLPRNRNESTGIQVGPIAAGVFSSLLTRVPSSSRTLNSGLTDLGDKPHWHGSGISGPLPMRHPAGWAIGPSRTDGVLMQVGLAAHHNHCSVASGMVKDGSRSLNLWSCLRLWDWGFGWMGVTITPVFPFYFKGCHNFPKNELANTENN